MITLMDWRLNFSIITCTQALSEYDYSRFRCIKIYWGVLFLALSLPAVALAVTDAEILDGLGLLYPAEINEIELVNVAYHKNPDYQKNKKLENHKFLNWKKWASFFLADSQTYFNTHMKRRIRHPQISQLEKMNVLFFVITCCLLVSQHSV